eukprot:11730606-Karenia_brevis.AAC.1
MAGDVFITGVCFADGCCVVHLCLVEAIFVEEYFMLGIKLYVIVGLKRFWDRKNFFKTSGLSEPMNLCFTG